MVKYYGVEGLDKTVLGKYNVLISSPLFYGLLKSEYELL